MRVTAEHQEIMSGAIVPLDTTSRRAAYAAGDFPRADRVQDLDKRYRWDLFWLAFDQGSFKRDGCFILGHYNDAHLDTALRSIVPPLGEKPRS